MTATKAFCEEPERPLGALKAAGTGFHPWLEGRDPVDSEPQHTRAPTMSGGWSAETLFASGNGPVARFRAAWCGNALAPATRAGVSNAAAA